MIPLSELIKNKRNELGLTQFQLAEKLGVSDDAVSKWERGKGEPDAKILPDIADALQLPIIFAAYFGRIDTANDITAVQNYDSQIFLKNPRQMNDDERREYAIAEIVFSMQTMKECKNDMKAFKDKQRLFELDYKQKHGLLNKSCEEEIVLSQDEYQVINTVVNGVADTVSFYDTVCALMPVFTRKRLLQKQKNVIRKRKI